MNWRDRLGRGWRALNTFHDQLFIAPWRAALAREIRTQEDTLVTLLYLEAMGVPGPADYLALALYPDLIEACHQQHRREGLEHMPVGGICC
ncbi:MAG: cory-CC-star protein [Salinisphaeraceae bacterium]|uniref:Cory-CC-star protein n=2 Tax=Spectribacter TaxID=3160928 RepID=A0ABU3BXS9_9GAMM|nr:MULTISPECIES: cory-CC-star protein [unclassified Salinisphaera]MDT0617723.1 cory-CC-star protein [Salinisphaera sp. P385]MDT0634121.1 cory-CC-star protein [Salinisphaera sp. W335]